LTDGFDGVEVDSAFLVSGVVGVAREFIDPDSFLRRSTISSYLGDLTARVCSATYTLLPR